ncbi:hypothetical protein Lepto7376_2369 [[Leptolyngbya] sp. PCC 7376]|uniref:mCpol domain-containing protein n=1 Tax=[Leptolyngbya] sp. PCC 7376 TaxID=111781 RepID=UPI00029EFA46|nr:mCpol domain-containing protein [[Leptolyngbya] sp. PCC 7376]AFY38652.1 hypothetical protein Lepto7376_2369 [[Leptolyngbya] sp. PCC 7376]
MFISIDGDDVGRNLELYILDEQIGDLEIFAKKLKTRFEWLANNLSCLLEAQVHLLGGDSILASCPLNPKVFQILEELRIEFQKQGLPSISIGTGNTAREAYLALKYAKLRGKNRLVTFEDIQQ